jgi:hypothetical protein
MFARLRPTMRTLVKPALGLAFSGALVGWTACSALQAVQGGVQTGVGGVQSAGSTVDTGKGLVDQGKGLVGKKKNPDGSDEGQGDDDDRLHAKEGQINTPLDDKVDFKKQDKEDWRKFQLQGKPGIATFELFWDDDQSNLELDVFDAYGVNIGRSPPRMEGQSVKRILVQIKKAGTFYVRVRAPTDKDRSIYTLNVKWDGPPVVAKAPDPPPNPAGTPPNPTPNQPPPGPVSPLTDPNKLLGSIISAYRDGPGWVLYIDKGSGAKVRQGMSGQILEGSDGDKLLEKGDFTISQVVDGGRSIARTNLTKPPGKNKRVLINLR